MIPTIVVRNNPSPKYIDIGPGPGQRQQVLDLIQFEKQLYELQQQKNLLSKELQIQKKVNTESKESRKEQKTLIKNLEVKELQLNFKIYELVENIKPIKKHIDYCALLTATLPDVQIIDSLSNSKHIASTTGPYVVRAMATKKLMEHARRNGDDYVFLENGYFGNYKNSVNKKSKKQWHRICVNEMQQESILKVPDDRWRNLVHDDCRLSWPGWKKNGSKILLVIPSSKPCDYYNQNVEQWKTKTINEIKKHTDREIVVREKASRTERTQKKTIYEALDEDIFCMVTYQSIAAVEAVAYGIPVFTLAPSAAKHVGLQDLSKIETPYYPDPELVYQWCCSLAYGQFSMEEMLNGTAWRMVWENQEREKISC